MVWCEEWRVVLGVFDRNFRNCPPSIFWKPRVFYRGTEGELRRSTRMSHEISKVIRTVLFLFFMRYRNELDSRSTRFPFDMLNTTTCSMHITYFCGFNTVFNFWNYRLGFGLGGLARFGLVLSGLIWSWFLLRFPCPPPAVQGQRKTSAVRTPSLFSMSRVPI